MVKIFLFLGMVMMCGASALLKDLKCDGGAPEVSTSWLDMQDNCTQEMRRQIQMEVDASYAYLAMASYFSRDEVNMPGFAHTFFHSASEERSHALALIEYLLMRGPGNVDQKLTDGLIKTPQQEKLEWTNGLEALQDALETEVKVTKSIRKVIQACEAPENANDYHLVDYLTSEFLDEQYKGQREIAGRIATLSKMMKNSESLGLFLFDKELLA